MLSSGVPMFLSGQTGPLFALYYEGASKGANAPVILHVPAFADEMNKSRHMVALQAKSFAEMGYRVMILDLFGTGDSGGDFVEAAWSSWLFDIQVGLNWLRDRGATSITLWGLRLGALLAADFCIQHPRKVDCLLLWQPATKGKAVMTQFLRLKIAANMMKKGSKDTLKDIRGLLENGKSVEIAGYELNSALYKAIDSLDLSSMQMEGLKTLYWLELGSTQSDEVLLGNRKALDAQSIEDRFTSACTVSGPAFWSTQEIASAPNLLDVTCSLFESPGSLA